MASIGLLSLGTKPVSLSTAGVPKKYVQFKIDILYQKGKENIYLTISKLMQITFDPNEMVPVSSLNLVLGNSLVS